MPPALLARLLCWLASASLLGMQQPATDAQRPDWSVPADNARCSRIGKNDTSIMAKPRKHAISPTREENYPEWFQQVVRAADLAETSDVRGCMVIKPWGYAIWEAMQRKLDAMFKATGHENAYFPLFIPLSFLEKEAEHVEGFAKECAVVTHHRIEPSPDGGLRPSPAAELEEPLIVRPTSETIIGATFSRWVQSHRDLPILINQWANVVRWEMRTRVFLRTAEFLWQEGHTAHATEAEAVEETERMLQVYATFAEETMAMPVVQGAKTASERFPGAVATYSIEAMMQDRKALQAGTSHFLGQNFSRAQDIKFQDEHGQEVFAWTTSWGVSTRLVGGLIMTHGDDDGLVIPPRLAPAHVVILPIYRNDDEKSEVLPYCDSLMQQLSATVYDGEALRVRLDDRDIRGGEKKWQWIKRGVPLRIEVGPRDIAANAFRPGRRDEGGAAEPVTREKFVQDVPDMLAAMQRRLFDLARQRRDEVTVSINDFDTFREFFAPQNGAHSDIHGGFAYCDFVDDAEIEEKLKPLKVTPRCIPLGSEPQQGRCIFTGKPATERGLFAKAY